MHLVLQNNPPITVETTGERGLHIDQIDEVSFGMGQIAVHHENAPELSLRLANCAVLAAVGLSKNEIARQRVVSGSTIKTQMSELYARLGVHKQAALPAKCLETGFFRIVKLGSPIDLKPAELRVVKLIAKGYLLAEVAAEFGLSLGTVKTHLANIGERLGTGNQVSIVMAGLTSGEISYDRTEFDVVEDSMISAS